MDENPHVEQLVLDVVQVKQFELQRRHKDPDLYWSDGHVKLQIFVP